MTTTLPPSLYTVTDALLSLLIFVAVIAVILFLFAALTHSDD